MWLDEDLTLEGLGTGVAPARTRRRPGARVGAAPAWVRDRLATTPGRLVLVSILVVVGAVCFGAIATGAEQSRERAAKAARCSAFQSSSRNRSMWPACRPPGAYRR